MIFAVLILAVSLVLCTQMACTTWRDIKDDEFRIRLEISQHLRDRR